MLGITAPFTGVTSALDGTGGPSAYAGICATAVVLGDIRCAKGHDDGELGRAPTRADHLVGYRMGAHLQAITRPDGNGDRRLLRFVLEFPRYSTGEAVTKANFSLTKSPCTLIHNTGARAAADLFPRARLAAVSPRGAHPPYTIHNVLLLSQAAT